MSTAEQRDQLRNNNNKYTNTNYSLYFQMVTHLAKHRLFFHETLYY